MNSRESQSTVEPSQAKSEPEATQCPPGSVEKLMVMTERFEANTQLFHNHDVGFSGWHCGDWTRLDPNFRQGKRSRPIGHCRWTFKEIDQAILKLLDALKPSVVEFSFGPCEFSSDLSLAGCSGGCSFCVDEFQKESVVMQTNQTEDLMRGTGRTTAGMLRTVAHALETPDQWVPYADHSGVTDPNLFEHLFLQLAKQLNLCLCARRTDCGVEIHSALKELQAQRLSPTIAAD